MAVAEPAEGAEVLVGRARLEAAIDKALDAAAMGEGTCLLLRGPTRSGRSALLGWACRSAAGRGFSVWSARADGREQPVPLSLVRDLFLPERRPGPSASSAVPAWLGENDSAALVTRGTAIVSDPRGAAALRALLERERSLTDLSRGLLFAEVTDRLLPHPERSPVLIALDDLDGADAESVDFLHHLAGTLAGRSVLLLGTVADDPMPVGSTDALPARLGVGSAQILSIDPLTRHETRDLLERRGPGSTPLDRYVEAIHRRSGGLPGAVLDLVQWFTESDLVGLDRGGADPVEEMRRRMLALGDEPLRLLTMAAVLGRRFPGAVLGRALRRKPPEALDAGLRALVDAGFLRVAGEATFEFSRRELRDELYRRLTDDRRRALHRAIARAFESGARGTGPEVFDAAWHYARSDDARSAVDLGHRAAELAFRRYAHRAARGYLTEARTTLGGIPDAPAGLGARLTVELAHAEAREGRIDEAVATLEQARAEARPDGDPSFLLVPASEVRADLVAHSRTSEELARRALAAFERTADRRWLAVAHRGLGVAAWCLAEPSLAEEHHRQAAELAHEVGDARLEGQSLLDRAQLVRLLDPSGTAAARALLDEAIRRFDARPDPEWLARAYLDRAAVLREQGRLPSALADLGKATEYAARTASPALQAWTLLRAARVLAEEGKTGRARRLLDQVRAVAGEPPSREVAQQVAYLEGLVLEREGRLERARRSYLESLSLAEQAGAAPALAETHRRLGELDRREGHPEEAERHFAEARSRAETLGPAGDPRPPD